MSGISWRQASALATFVLFYSVPPALAQPAIASTSGTWSHQSSVTINGSGFGSKGTAAPAVWDDASGASVAAIWDGAWPDCGGNSSYNLEYRTPAQVGRNIPLPHTRITKYIAGAHYGPSPSATCGYNVILWKTRTMTSFPSYSYVSWYERVDDNWHFGDDDNFKTFAYSEGVGPYNVPNNWYTEYNPRPTSPSSDATWHINDDGTSLQRPDQNGHSHWWGQAINPMGGVWTKVEMEIKYTNASDGYIKLWENGVLKMDYLGRTDNMPGSTRTEGIGGYARNYPYTSNWRYFADVYLDYSRARVILGNAPTYAASTLREVQVPTAWSGSAVSVKVNLGAFAASQTAYLYVVNPSGQVNNAGIAITVGSGGGGGGDTTAPSVAITHPANAATVSSTVSVTASASDNVAVTGVQFKINGANVGAEDTTAPYAIGWDTIAGVDGAYTLTAVARDAAGNTSTSAPIGVTVNNAPPPPPPPPPPPSGGLVGAYNFDAGAGAIVADYSGHANDGTISGATWVAEGRHGAGLAFDGSNDVVSIPDAASLDLTSALTLEAWVKPTNVTSWRSVIMKEIDGGLAYALYANDSVANPSAYVHVTTESLSHGVGTTSPLPLDVWSHVAATYDGATLRLYVNGSEVGSYPVTGTIMTSANPLRIGGNAVWGEYYAGTIDDVRIYNRALTPTEIQSDLATAVSPPATPPAPPTNLRVVQ